MLIIYFQNWFYLNNLFLRSIIILLTSFLSIIFLGQIFIKKLIQIKIKQSIRTYGPQSHLLKVGTPTMGGILVLGSILINCIMWCNIFNKFVLILIFVIISFSYIGYIDDHKKIIMSDAQGISAINKLLLQIIFGMITAFFIALAMLKNTNITYFWQIFDNFFLFDRSIFIPFINFNIHLNFWQFVILTTFIIVASSNAVNLTDGLDGLVIFLVAVISLSLALLSYCFFKGLLVNKFIIDYSNDIYELTLISFSILGASLAFLLFNSYPAKIFLGDIGSLPLGALIATIAIIIQQEVVFFIMSGLLVIETMSVLLQVIYFKLTKQIFGKGIKIFRMSPLHHHFELLGYEENKIVVGFWILNILLVIISLCFIEMK
ncbi:Phospho-N-acetylmuramoyl-pentapeptide- transferase [Candidatus Kinetoplastibacterium sorsogonicusi]|uniref:Phospho-N-acetylmuramoyl-pentapeptide-transferase n=1 Tax=Candidatus Kinetoplastidibacterium kentomonadis TaxID=1576550 RepID=A0A3Q8ERN6_9PROT|nr:phospho-N-acetylmuramoyl-pentapeptide-transferase [Candidatus Kinetoplastibacterium sorsogonicusi]AWD32661.1 Phospho-N-acetylmuramoyl-pentapeptide- transferase [Candidatus Kinetoplastibacterium sorsogonicusi]